MTPWQDIATAPRDGTPVLIFRSNAYHHRKGPLRRNIVVAYWRDGYWLALGSIVSNKGVTHWMPLPPPPSGGEKT